MEVEDVVAAEEPSEASVHGGAAAAAAAEIEAAEAAVAEAAAVAAAADPEQVASAPAFGRGARARRAPTWSRDAPEEMAPRRFAKTGGVPLGRRKVAGASGTAQQALQPPNIMQGHLTHWRGLRRHAQRQFTANLLRHRTRLQVLLALSGDGSEAMVATE